MSQEANIETERWYEFRGDLASTGFFDDSQLTPDIVQRKFNDVVKGYTTVIGFVGEGRLQPVGSGTFVQCADGQYGILTAGHVVGAIDKQDRVVVTQGIEELEWVRIEARYLEACGKSNDGQKGPDIGWITLSPHEAKNLEAKRAVFYNLARPREGFPRPFSRIGVVLGFLAETSRPEAKALGFHATFTGKPRHMPTDAGGWDYVEYSLDADDLALPSTHKGVSGSGVWRIDLPNDGTAEKQVFLVGVAFAEGLPNDRKLFTHGENSVQLFRERLARTGGDRRQ